MTQTHTHTNRRRSKPNLLDHINLFPSKEEGRIPGERNVLSERRIMWFKAGSCDARKVIGAIRVTSYKEKCVILTDGGVHIAQLIVQVSEKHCFCCDQTVFERDTHLPSDGTLNITMSNTCKNKSQFYTWQPPFFRTRGSQRVWKNFIFDVK